MCGEKMRKLLVILAVLMVPMMLAPTVAADGGYFSRYSKRIYEPWQKAVIAWNGTHEVMILQVNAEYIPDKEIEEIREKIVHVIPFPSKPEYHLENEIAYSRGRNLVDEYWNYEEPYPWWGDGDSAGGNGGGIISHEQVGPHDIQVAYITSGEAFLAWTKSYFFKNGLTDLYLPNETVDIVNHYLLNGCPYFVFDIISIEAEDTKVEPLSYKFESDSLFYPLAITSLTGGETNIELVCITPENWIMNFESANNEGIYMSQATLRHATALPFVSEKMIGMFDGPLTAYLLEGSVNAVELDSDIIANKIDPIWHLSDDTEIQNCFWIDTNGDGIDELGVVSYNGVYGIDIENGTIIWNNNTIYGWKPVSTHYEIIEYLDGKEMVWLYHSGAAYVIDPYKSTDHWTITIGGSYPRFVHQVNAEKIIHGDVNGIRMINLTTGRRDWYTSLNHLDDPGSIDEFYFALRESGLYPDSRNWQVHDRFWDVFYYPYGPLDLGSPIQEITDDNGTVQYQTLRFWNSIFAINIDNGSILWENQILNTTEYFEGQYWGHIIDEVFTTDDLDGDGISDVVVLLDEVAISISGKNGSLIDDNHTRNIGLIATRSLGYRSKDSDFDLDQNGYPNIGYNTISRYHIDHDGDGDMEHLLITIGEVFLMEDPEPIPKLQYDVTLGPFTYSGGSVPYEKAKVTLVKDDGTTYNLTTNSKGECDITLSPGYYNCSVEHNGKEVIGSFDIIIGKGGYVLYDNDGNRPPSSDEIALSNIIVMVGMVLVFLAVLGVCFFMVRHRNKKEEQDDTLSRIQ